MLRRLCLLLALLLCCASGAGQPVDEKIPSAALEARGILVPARRASVTSAVPGRVAEVLVEEGQAVKAGQVLIRLERTGAEAEMRRVEARLELAFAGFKRVEAREGEELAARAAVTRAEALLQAADTTLTRLNRLRDARVVAVEELQNAEQAQRVARADLDRARVTHDSLRKDLLAHRAVARAEVEVAKARADQARRAVDATEIRAAIDGLVIGLNAELGAHTNPALFGLANSATLAEVADTSVMKVLVEVKESDLARVARGQKCEVGLIADPKARLQGTVERLSPVVSRGMVAVWVRLDGKSDPALRIGMSATVRFVSPSSP